MQKNYKLILILVLSITVSTSIFAQDIATYKEVVLDGKPAKLNVTTGEITLINAEENTKNELISATVEAIKKEVAESTAVETVDNNLTASDYHVVKKGENLLKLSERYNMSLRDLKNANNLETTLIRPGQRLRVKNINSVNYSSSATNSQNTNSYSADIHLVKKGETLYGLSKKYGITVSDLKQKNSLSSNLIIIGQTLNISAFNTSNNSTLVWTVSKGDTLYGIARKNGTTVDAIKHLNGLTSNLISIGQKLQLD